jgi:hypothetical protein
MLSTSATTCSRVAGMKRMLGSGSNTLLLVAPEGSILLRLALR